MREDNIDARKHRKSTHLASADLDAMTVDGKALIFTIKEVWFETAVDVSGTKTDGYFCSFMEPVKDLILNSGNRKILAGFAGKSGHDAVAKWNIGNWKGLKIELYVDRAVKMMGAITDGIRIKPIQPVDKPKPVFTEANFEKAAKAKATVETIEKAYQLTEEIKTKYLEYVRANGAA